MKREQREPYHTLIDMMPAGYGLCNFCKFASWSGGSCCDSDLECEHRLSDRMGFPDPFNVWEGADCWGFYPKESLQEIGVAVSIMLDGNNPHRSNKYGGIIAIRPSKHDRDEGLVGVYV